MNNFTQRAITGTVFVAVMLAAIILNKFSFILMLAFISVMCLYEFFRLFKEQKHLNPISVVIFGVLFLSLMLFYGISPVLLLAVFSISLIIYNLFSFKKDIFTSAGLLAIGLLYFIYPFAYSIMLFAPFSGITHDYSWFLYLMIIVWSNDTFAYLGGKTFGKHKLIPEISPNKTIEGFVSGLIFASLASFLMAYFGLVEMKTVWHLHLLMGIIYGSAATVGDLIQSSVKRMAGAKDSGKLLPGHGGLWDRFDGMIAVLWAYIIVLQVSVFLPF